MNPVCHQKIYGVETRRGAPLRSKPGVDNGIAVLVWQGVSQQSRQPLEGVPCQCWKFIGKFGKWHGDRSQCNAASQEVRRVLKDPDLPVFKPGDGTDQAPSE